MLRDLITRGGGKMAQQKHGAGDYILVADTASLLPSRNHPMRHPVPVDWLLECVTHDEILPVEDYLKIRQKKQRRQQKEVEAAKEKAAAAARVSDDDSASSVSSESSESSDSDDEMPATKKRKPTNDQVTCTTTTTKSASSTAVSGVVMTTKKTSTTTTATTTVTPPPPSLPQAHTGPSAQPAGFKTSFTSPVVNEPRDVIPLFPANLQL